MENTEATKLLIRAVHRLNRAVNLIATGGAIRALLPDKDRQILKDAVRQGYEDTEEAAKLLNGGKMPDEL